MRGSLGGGSGSGSRGMGGGSGGGSVQMLRSVQRAVKASASQEPFSHSNTSNSSPSKNSTSAGRRARQTSTTAYASNNRANSLTLSSASTSSPFYPHSSNLPISASSTAWPSSPTFSDESSDWLCVEGLEDDKAQFLHDDFVFGTVPSKDEVHHAVAALQEVLDPGSTTYLAKDGSVNKLDSDVAGQVTSHTGSIQVASPFGSKSDWIEPPSQLWSSGLSQARGYDRIQDAFYLLRNEPSIQRMVVSLSSDRAVWDAVLNNEVVQELREAFNPDNSISDKSSEDGDDDGPATDVAKSLMKWIIANAKAKVMEFIDKMTKVVNELFHADPEEEDGKTGEKRGDPFEEKLRASFILSIVVMLIVVVSRTRA